MTKPVQHTSDRKFEILAVLLYAVTAILFFSLATDGLQGGAARKLTDIGEVPNALGTFGAFIAGILYILLGKAAHVIYIMTFIWASMLLRHRSVDRLPTRFAGFLMLTGSVAGLLHVDSAIETSTQTANTIAPLDSMPGGPLGAFAAHIVEPTFGIVGSNVIFITLAVIGVLLATEFLFIKMAYGALATLVLAIRCLGLMGRKLSARVHAWRLAAKENSNTRAKPDADSPERQFAPGLSERLGAKISSLKRIVKPDTPVLDDAGDLSRMRVSPPDAPQELPFDEVPEVVAATEEPAQVETIPEPLKEDPPEDSLQEVELAEPILAAEPVEAAPPPAAVVPKKPKKSGLRRKTNIAEELPEDYVYPKRYKKPPLSLLETSEPLELGDLTESLRQTGVLLEETLQTFGVEARVTDITRGPTITRFETEPSPGVKVSRFMALADDLALALKAHRVRVEAPIPGKGKVGIEVPNDQREDVVIRDLLESRAFKREKGALPLALGKDIAGGILSVDLATMPHCLVAGATGAGKTVCIKTILASLLFTKTPDELQLMLIDPKMVELSIFNDVPHLITPVVIDPKKAAASLNWLINEMEERYRLFAHLRVRNIEVYNERVDNGEIEVENDGDDDADVESLEVIRKLPYIVCIIDELADLMMLARAEVEDAIARLAQLARAVGIHLIIATQRPSVDVLTGVIKANFPARVSFQVSSRVDSRCILDEIGAERLIGRGDLLYLPAGQSKPTRVQGAFVSDEEMNDLIAYLKTQAPPQYRDEIEKFGKQQGSVDDLLDEGDELLEDAINIVIETGQASISMVQRRLRVGYTRAARLIDMMEMKGIVGPHVGSKAREILVEVAHNNGEGT